MIETLRSHLSLCFAGVVFVCVCFHVEFTVQLCAFSEASGSEPTVYNAERGTWVVSVSDSFLQSSYSFTRQSSGFLVGYTRRLSGRTDVKWLFLMHRLCNAQTVLSSLCSGYADDICGQTACGEPKTIQRFLPGIVSKCFKASVCFSVVPSSPAI